MSLITIWREAFGGRFRALILNGVLGASVVCCGALAARGMEIDDGTNNVPATIPTTIRSMPILGSGSELTFAGTSTTNIGAFDIVLSPSPALASNPAALAAFNRAVQNWEFWIADPITITINADFSALGPGILGSTGTVLLQSDYNTIRNQLVVDALNEPDDAIVLSMPTAAQFTANVPVGFALNGNLTIAKANAKAMGFGGLDAAFGAEDAEIAFSTGFTFDFDKSNGITPGQFDFEGIATHEIGHALGFLSAVDDVDEILPGTTNQLQPFVLDLFRFRDNSASDPATAANFTTFARDLVPGAVDIFDQVIGGFGGSTEVLFSTGANNGDGRQASHWKDNLGLGIMDPTVSPGEFLSMTQNDLRAMDLIGYELSVPEAGRESLAAIGGILVVVGRKNRARK